MICAHPRYVPRGVPRPTSRLPWLVLLSTCCMHPMIPRMRWYPLGTFLLITPLLYACQQNHMTYSTIEFLGFEGCPNTPNLLDRLQVATRGEPIVEVDLMTLETGDPRLGWGAPTILVDGKDLFGVEPSPSRAVSCRNWSMGLPEVHEIKTALRTQTQ